jgi:large subunit ribosomal protein L15
VTQKLNLSSLKPAAPRRDRKRVGRGPGSGKGRYSGRGIKGQKARSGSHKMRPGFEGGQMPIYMQLGKQRGPYSKDAMPMGPHRTKVFSVNVRDLERFDGEVTPELLKAAGLIRNTRFDVKILGHGELTKKLSVSAHLFSASAREKIEQAGGTITWLRGEPKPRAPKRREKRAAPPPEEPEAETAPEEPLQQSVAKSEEGAADVEGAEESPPDEPAGDEEAQS